MNSIPKMIRWTDADIFEDDLIFSKASGIDLKDISFKAEYNTTGPTLDISHKGQLIGHVKFDMDSITRSANEYRTVLFGLTFES